MPHDISLTETGRKALLLLLAIFVYTAWRWAYLGRSFQKNALRYGLAGVAVTFLALMAATALTTAASLLIFGRTNNLRDDQNQAMMVLLFVLILVIGYAIRRYLWKHFSTVQKDEIESIGTSDQPN